MVEPTFQSFVTSSLETGAKRLPITHQVIQVKAGETAKSQGRDGKKCQTNKRQISIHASIHHIGLSLMHSTTNKLLEIFFFPPTGRKNNCVFCDQCYLRCNEIWWLPWFPIVPHSPIQVSHKTHVFFKPLKSL